MQQQSGWVDDTKFCKVYIIIAIQSTTWICAAVYVWTATTSSLDSRKAEKVWCVCCDVLSHRLTKKPASCCSRWRVYCTGQEVSDVCDRECVCMTTNHTRRPRTPDWTGCSTSAGVLQLWHAVTPGQLLGKTRLWGSSLHAHTSSPPSWLTLFSG